MRCISQQTKTTTLIPSVVRPSAREYDRNTHCGEIHNSSTPEPFCNQGIHIIFSCGLVPKPTPGNRDMNILAATAAVDQEWDELKIVSSMGVDQSKGKKKMSYAIHNVR